MRRQTVPVAPGLDINPRDGWADAAPTGPLETEAPGDARFLLVHHTASSNDYQPDEVVAQLRSFYRFHTGPEKQWPDIAYNILIDRFGGVWEGRAGSLDAPIKGSATGGSQGYALLTCLIGNHDEAPPTSEALASLQRVLAWLAEREAIDIAPGAETSFVSRGSNRWPEGSTVTTPTITGHRSMSNTTCPGQFVDELLASTIIPGAYSLVAEVPTPTTPATTTSTSTTERSTSTSTSASSTTTSASASSRPSDTALALDRGSGAGSGATGDLVAGRLGYASVALAAIAGVVALRRRTRRT